MSVDKAFLDQVTEGLYELFDTEFQRRVWVRGEGPEVSSPSESVSQLFDDTGLGDLLEESDDEPVISLEVDAILRRLGELLDRVSLAGDAADLLRDPRWKDVQQTAARALDAIRALDADEESR